MITPNVTPYDWLSEAIESLNVRRPDAPLLSQAVSPLAQQARPFSLPPYTMTDPPFKGYLFESEPAVTKLERYRQPFPVIALQFPILDEGRRMPTVAIVSHDEESEQLFVVQANKLPGRSDWTWASVGLSVSVKGPLQHNGLHMRPYSFAEKLIPREDAQAVLGFMNPAIMAAYELAVVLQCQNVSIVRVGTSQAINDKRRRKGKRQLPSGYVICVAQDVTRRGYNEAEKPVDLTRSKPRTHFRRGHIRQLQSGATVWVSHTMVKPGTNPLNSKYTVMF